jgi:uncharacterized membrane protein YcaP (DUF421 family)
MELVIRATVIYWFLWLIVRGSGKRSLAELTPLDLLLIVVLGDFVQQGVTQEDMSMTGAILAVSVFVMWTVAADALSRRSRRASRVLASPPVVIVKGGMPLMDQLQRERMTLEELKEAARIKGYANLSDIDFCVLESDGEFSFIRRAPEGG